MKSMISRVGRRQSKFRHGAPSGANIGPFSLNRLLKTKDLRERSDGRSARVWRATQIKTEALLSLRPLGIGPRRQRRVAHSFVTARAGIHVERVIARERASPVVALQTVVPRTGEMLEDLDVGDLSRIRCSIYHVVTLVAGYALSSRVVLMAKDRAKVVLRLCRAVVGAERVTRRASADRRIGFMTGEAVIVRRDPDRDGLAGTRGRMTMRAARSRAAFACFVRRVVEAHIKSLDELCRKGFHRRRSDVHLVVTDRAHSRFLAGVCELT